MTTAARTSEGAQEELFNGEALDQRSMRTRNSALWAAYGDALGFISELAPEKMLKRRTGGAALDRLMAWERRVGGRGGVAVRLPAGCWSDDTQLRMAVSRAISHRGFDVESFARVELPVWPSYELGGGRASKAAAKRLGKPNSLWYANTFPRWAEAGGNGAAMRIQPHVWSSPELNGEYLGDVIVDSICTHGHLRAIVGACFHAATLAYCLQTGAIPDLQQCQDIADSLNSTTSLVESHRSIGSTWIGLWEQETSKHLDAEWTATVSELREAIEKAEISLDVPGDTSALYRGICEQLGLYAKHQRGSGILTSVAAVVLSRIAQSAHEALLVAANALGTDTDTIATMAGALVGACDGTDQPPEDVLDSDYLLAEADRLVAISRGQEVPGHSYPDLLTWTAPGTQADGLVSNDGRLSVEGLGSVTETDQAPSWTPRKDFGWQWVRTEFGQTLLIKRRPEVRSLGAGNAMTPPPAPVKTRDFRRSTKLRNQASDRSNVTRLAHGVDLDRAIEYVRRHIDDNQKIGYTIRELARRGTHADLAYVLGAVRDDLRRVSARPAHHGRTSKR